MKKIISFIAFFLISYVGFSQTKGISYQAVIIDPNPIQIPGSDITGQPYVSKDVWIRFGIYAGTTLQYEELHKTKTDEYGLVNLIIGAGVNTGKAGTFTSLSWDGVTKNVITSVSFDQGGRYTEVSNQKFNYVPYTLLAETAVKLAGVLPIASGGTGATNAIAARTNLGLGNVDNTADVDKPVSIPTLAILDAKESLANKSTNIIADSASLVKYPSVKAIKDYIDSRNSVSANNARLAAKATALETPRTINGIPFDGTANITIPVGVTPPDADATTKGLVQLAGDLTGTAAAPAIATGSVSTAKIADVAITTGKLAASSVTTVKVADGAITDAKITSIAGSKVAGNIAGNAATSTKLAAPKNINGVPFDGSSDITISTSASTISGTIAIANGGTGASTAAGARTNLGLVIGSDVLAQRTFGTAANSAITDFVLATEKGANNGVATLGVNGKIPSNQIPAISFQNVNVVNSDAAMTSIAGAQVGSIAIRTDNNNNYVLSALPASNLQNWIALATPLYVSTVNGYAGPNVSLTTNDVPEGSTNKYYTDAKVRSAITATGPLNFNSSTGVLSMTTASTTSGGFLTASDFTNFNNKQTALTAGVDYATPGGNITGNAANVTGIVSIANGGTGTSTASGALVALGAEPSANKSNDILLDGNSTTKFPSFKAIKDYVDQQSANAGVADNSITSAKINGTLAVLKGGTGASTAAGARTNLGLVIGTDVMAANFTTTLTGDLTGSGNGTFATTLANSGVTSGTYGSSTAIPTITVDSKGRITSAGTVGIIAGVNSLNYTSNNSYATGGTISGTSLTLAAADGTNPGLISTGSQTIAGAKTFSNDVTAPNFIGNASTATTAGNITATSNTTITSLANLNSVGTITSGTWSATEIAIAKGGTGATTPAAARANLGLIIGTDVQGPLVSGTDYIAPNASITGATKTKITYDAKGLVTAGTDATTADIAPSTNRNYVTDAQAGVISNTSGVNTGDQTITLTGDVTGSGTGSFATTLANSGVSSGTYGSSTAIPVLTVDSKGRLTSASTVGIIAGVNSMNYTSTTSYAAGGTISGTTLTLAAADATNPGLLSTGAQTIAGSKTFTNDITASNFIGNASTATTAGNITATSNTTITSLANLNSVGTITSGTWSATEIAIAKGGTGATTAADARTNLGLTIGTDVMAANATTTLTGDVSGSGSGTFTTTINSVGGVSSSTISGFNARITTNTNDIALRATIASPSFTGTPTAPTPTTGDNSTKIATTEYVQASITAASAGVSSVGPISATANVNGATISGSSQLILTPASANFGGVVTTATQTFAGAKTFSNTTTFNTDITVNGVKIGLGNTGVPSNTGVGFGTLASVNTALANNLTALGYNALTSNTTGYSNTAVGHNALLINNTGFNNTAIGRSALSANAGGQGNFAGGLDALVANNSGSLNTGVGAYSLRSNTSGGSNTAVGYMALANLFSSSGNTALGIRAGEKYGSGSGTNLFAATNGVFIGANARAYTSTSTNEIVIGADAVGNGSNTVTVGNLSNSATYFTGDINLTGRVVGGTWSGTNIAITNGGTGATTAADARTNLGLAIGTDVMAANATTTLTGDITGTGSGTFTTTLANSGVTASTYGSSTAIPTFTVDAKGRITSATEVGIIAGVNTLTYTTGTAYANGGTVSGTTLTLSAADGNNPGLISTGAQTIAGAKTFTNDITSPNFIGNASTATTAGNITATSNTTLTSLSNLASVGTITSGTWSGSIIGSNVGGAGTINGLLKANGSGIVSAAISGTDYQTPLTAGSGISISSGTISVTGLTASNLASNAAITNAQLANSTTILGSTTMTLGGTVTSVTGLTSLSSTSLIGTLSGTASTANILTTSRAINGVPFNGSADITIAADANTLTGTTLASNVVNSSLTGVGTITSGVWSGTAIAIANGGTGATTASGARTNLGLGSLATKSTIANADVASGAAIDFAKLNITKSDITGLGIQDGLTAGSGISLASGTISVTGLTSSNLSSTAGITNAQLAYSTTTLGSTTLTLGGTVTSVTGLTSLAATNLSGALTGNASTATTLATARNINGVAFDGSANITIAADANTLTGTTLASNVVNSSLTGVGTVTSGTWSGTAIAIANGGTGATTKTSAFNALSPMTTLGDIIYGAASGTGTRLGIGSTGQVLTVTGGLPTWATPSGISTLTAIGSSPNANGGTISGTTLNLEPASASFGGVVTTGSQTFAGAKTFNSDIIANQLTIGKGLYTATGSTNTAFGISALAATTNLSNSNVGVGYYAMNANTSGTENTAVGNNALKSNTTGLRNTVVGSGAMQNAAPTGSNVAQNTSIGAGSLTALNTGNSNTAVGYNSGSTLTTGTDNVLIGNGAASGGISNLLGTIIIGSGTMPAATGDNNEIVIGYGATGLGSNSTVIGINSTTQAKIFGALELPSTTSSTSTTTGALKIAGGAGIAGALNVGGTTTIIGAATISNTTASTSTTTGALKVAGGAGIVGDVYIGGTLSINGANAVLTTGDQTIAGVKTFSSNITSNGVIIGKLGGTDNVVVGNNALNASTTSDYNTALGNYALNYVTSGGNNVAVGTASLYNNTTGTYNTAVGRMAISSGTTGANNTALGYAAGQQSTTGSGNTFLGTEAGRYITSSGTVANATGSNSVFVGYNTSPLTNGDANEIVIAGYNGSTRTVGLGTNTTLIGNSSTTLTQLMGALNLPSTTTSTSTTTGALRVGGGAGIVGNLNVGGATTLIGAATISNTTTSNSTTTGALVVTGGVGVAGNLTVGGTIEIDGGSPGVGKVLTSNAGGLASWTSNPNTAIVSITSSTTYTIATDDKYVIYSNGTTGTITLPSAVSVGSGKEYIIKNISANSITVNTTSTQKIIVDNANNTATSVSLGIEASNNWIRVISDGAQWIGFRALF